MSIDGANSSTCAARSLSCEPRAQSTADGCIALADCNFRGSTAACRGTRDAFPSALAHELYRQCDCAHWFPARNVYPLELRQLLQNSPPTKKLATTDFVAAEPVQLPAAFAHWPCLSPQCLARHLAGEWVLFIGDSTQRHIHDSFLSILSDWFGAHSLTLQPHAGGLPVKDRDHHKDYDTVSLHASATAASRDRREWPINRPGHEKIPECTGPLHPECAKQHRPNVTHWAGSSASQPATLVSMRFLRGLDLHKLDLNSKSWRERYFYSEWRRRSMSLPPNMVFGSDSFMAHEVTRTHWSRRPEPSVIIFNSCAWDLPQINRSYYYYPYMVPGYPCAAVPAEMNVTVRIKEARVVPVKGAPCVKRGIKLSDEEIVVDYGRRLREAVKMIRSRFSGRLILRSCHAGTRDSRAKSHPQYEALRRMNSVLERVAVDNCLEVLDVFELDRLAGYHREKREANFHVPRRASLHGALAALLMLRLGHHDRGAGQTGSP